MMFYLLADAIVPKGFSFTLFSCSDFYFWIITHIYCTPPPQSDHGETTKGSLHLVTKLLPRLYHLSGFQHSALVDM